MQDTVSKNTGNSRSLKTVPNALTLYPTYEAMIAAMVNGTFPIDLCPLNPAGLVKKGDDLNKSTLLTDALCTALGLPTTATPTQAMEKLRQMAAAAQNTGNSKAQVIAGSYTGNGEPSQTIILGATPKAVFSAKNTGETVNFSGYTGGMYGGLTVAGSPVTTSGLTSLTITTNGFIVYNSSADRMQSLSNYNGYRFNYIAII